MSLETKYPQEVKQILSKYPPEQKRSAVMPLLYLAQREEGYLSKAAMQDVAQIVGITETDIAALVGFYTLYHDKKEGKYRMQVCTDLPCALRGADEFMNAKWVASSKWRPRMIYFCSTRSRNFSPLTFSYRVTTPWISASGRGGQPATYTSTGTISSTPCTRA